MPTNQIYFAQHGLAVDKSENPDRPLSAEGIRQTQAIADQLENASIPISQIFHSGKLRAQQTADIFANTFQTPSTMPAVTPLDYLSPNDDIDKLVTNLNFNNALYIGHLPYLDKLISFLTTVDEAVKMIEFRNSGVVCLGKNNETCFIRWYITPETLQI